MYSECGEGDGLGEAGFQSGTSFCSCSQQVCNVSVSEVVIPSFTELHLRDAQAVFVVLFMCYGELHEYFHFHLDNGSHTVIFPSCRAQITQEGVSKSVS